MDTVTSKKCFGIGCPLRNGCAVFATHGKKEGPFIEERYDFVDRNCPNHKPVEEHEE
jgi:hypothetical protein